MEVSDLLKDILTNVEKSLDIHSIIGTPIVSDDITVVPVSKMTVGFAGGGAEVMPKRFNKKNESPLNGLGGGATVAPVGFLVVDKSSVKFLKTEGGETWETCLESVLQLFVQH